MILFNTDCPYLEHRRYPQVGSTPQCGAGINFYAAGQDRELCQACSMASLGWLPDCGHLDANAWLEDYPGGALFVRAELFCGLTGDPLPSLLHCACCLERHLSKYGQCWPVSSSNCRLLGRGSRREQLPEGTAKIGGSSMDPRIEFGFTLGSLQTGSYDSFWQ